jgi:nitrogen-specific signal transduction histidine kinase
MLNAVGDVVIVVSRDRRIRYCNGAAEELLSRKRPVKVARGRLSCVTGEGNLQLGRAIDAVCMGDGPTAACITLRDAGPFALPLLIKCLDNTSDNILILAQTIMRSAPEWCRR